MNSKDKEGDDGDTGDTGEKKDNKDIKDKKDKKDMKDINDRKDMKDEKDRKELIVRVLINGCWMPGRVLKRIEPKEQFPVLYVVQLPDGIDVFSACRVRFV